MLLSQWLWEVDEVGFLLHMQTETETGQPRSAIGERHSHAIPPLRHKLQRLGAVCPVLGVICMPAPSASASLVSLSLLLGVLSQWLASQCRTTRPAQRGCPGYSLFRETQLQASELVVVWALGRLRDTRFASR